MTVALAVVALLVGAAALTLSVLVARQSAGLASTLERHRHGHALREGTLDPAAARSHRRQLNLGPPRSTGERRERPQDGPDPLPGSDPLADEPEAADESDSPRTGPLRSLPRPGQIGRARATLPPEGP